LDREDAPDAASVVTAIEVHEGFEGWWEGGGVFDEFAVHVGDVESAVWA
jgi:hypothetical protein